MSRLTKISRPGGRYARITAGDLNTVIDVVNDFVPSDGTLTADVISEETSATGVTIDGVLNKDGAVTSTAPNTYASGTSITAFATGGQASATALTKEFNEITTCATAGDSVKLPTAAAGLAITIKNDGAAACDVFPVTGGTINDGSANAAVRVEPGSTVTFRGTSATNWETSHQVVASLGNVVSGATSYHSFIGDLTTGISRVSNGVFNLDSAGTTMAKVTANGFQLLQRVILGGTPQTLTGAGAVSLDTFITLVVTTGANALTLAAGSEGQIKLIIMKTDGGDGTLTPSTLVGGTTITFNDANDLWLGVYTDSKWYTIVNSGCTIA